MFTDRENVRKKSGRKCSILMFENSCLIMEASASAYERVPDPEDV